MIHRALFGAFERFVGGLIEHYGGDFPLWTAPVQAKVMTVTDAGVEFAKDVYKRMCDEGIRVEADFRNEKIGYKIREAEKSKIRYMVIIGKREASSGMVSLRKHRKGDIGTFLLDDVIGRIKDEIQQRR
jgi:threonyl-tRNA synthetase